MHYISVIGLPLAVVMVNQKRVDFIFSNPGTPLFLDQDGTGTKFNVPAEQFPDEFKDISTDLESRFAVEDEETHALRMDVKSTKIPDIGPALKLDSNEMFSLYIPMHRNYANFLIDIFLDCKNMDQLESIAVFCRDRLNPYLFNYAFSIAMLNRTDAIAYSIPSLAAVLPEKFVDAEAIESARREASVVPEEARIPVTINSEYTSSSLYQEQRCAYFREDIGLNLLYWQWNVRYPFDGRNAIVNKDRRGELFYYFHHQILARYNCERLCNKLFRTKKLNKYHEPLPEGYYPKLNTQVTSRGWAPRSDNTILEDLDRETEGLYIDLPILRRWGDRIINAIEIGYAINEKGDKVELNNPKGVDIIGNMVQSTNLSPNRGFYGDVCNYGHIFIAYCHDPKNKYLESFGVMGDMATAMRDPVFYRWHTTVAEIFQIHKKKLSPYTQDNLDFKGIEVTSVSVQFQNKADGTAKNEFNTFFDTTDIDLYRGLDFVPKGHVFYKVTHLDHKPYSIKLEIENTGATIQGTVRLFMAPTYDEKNQHNRFTEQRLLMIELDRFVTLLQPGKNYIIRRSDEASVAIPLRNIYNQDKEDLALGAPYCGCGWPLHLLIPKGTVDGIEYDLFAMVTNYTEDQVDDSSPELCKISSSYCGKLNQKYPDTKPMGYPFDRPARENVEYLSQFITPNMAVQRVTIKHLGNLPK